MPPSFFEDMSEIFERGRIRGHEHFKDGSFGGGNRYAFGPQAIERETPVDFPLRADGVCRDINRIS